MNFSAGDTFLVATMRMVNFVLDAYIAFKGIQMLCLERRLDTIEDRKKKDKKKCEMYTNRSCYSWNAKDLYFSV